jgi:hypothetical protein
MFSPSHPFDVALMTPTTPWSIRAWPPVLWQAGREEQLRFHHLSTSVTLPGDRKSRTAGQTIWGGSSESGEAGVAWDWVQISGDVVAMADPMSVVTNLRLIGREGEVLTALEAARFLNEIVYALPWRSGVQRALHVGHA